MHKNYPRPILALLIVLIVPRADTRDEPAAAALPDGNVAGPFIALALRDNPGLAASNLRYEAARQSIDSAAALPNPMVQITHFVESIQTRTGPQEQSLMLQQPVPWPGKLGRRRDLARNQADALWHAFAAQQFEVVDKVAQKTLDVAYLDKAIARTQQNIALVVRLESIASNRVKAGGELGDLLRLQVELQRFEDQAAKLATRRAAAVASLEGLLGGPVPALATPLDWNAPQAIQAPNAWLAAIPERSPQLAMLRSLEGSQEARARLARLASRPDLTVGANYIRTGEAANPAMAGSGDDPWALMVGVSLPVWSKANNALALQASLEGDALAAQIRERTLVLRAEATAWIAQLQDSQARLLRYDEKLIPLARQFQEITQSSYQSGNATILELIDSERTLLELETEYWRAAADAWLARWKLATLTGGLWIE